MQTVAQMKAPQFALALVLVTVWVVQPVGAEGDEAFKKLLSAGDKLLMAGRDKYRDAVAKYGEAISMLPDDKRGYYRRAELYGLLREYEECTEDIKRALAIDPNHHQSLTLWSKILSARGEFIEASEKEARLRDIFTKAKNAKKAAAATTKERDYRALGTSWDLVRAELEAFVVRSRGDRAHFRQLNRRCTDVLKNIIVHVKDSRPLRIRRAECAIAAHIQSAASEELRVVLTQDPGDLYATALNARAMRLLGATDQAKTEVKRCLSLDPENRECVRLHKEIKKTASEADKVEALMGDKKWDAALQLVDAGLAVAEVPNEDQLMKWRCQIFVSLRNVDDGIAACSEVIDLENGEQNPQMANFYLHRADLHFMADDNGMAEADIKKAAGLEPNNERVREFQQRLENAKRNASRKNYYNLLDVPKTASEKDIRRAYRALARKYHPDHHATDLSPKEKERQEKLFRDLNEAKEILCDEEKRRRYDNGEDPANPNAQQQQQQHHGGHHMFHHGGFPGGGGGGGGFQFHFG